MQLETLREIRKKLTELEKEIQKEIGGTEKPLHAEAAMQEFPGETRKKTALYRKLQRTEKLLADAEDEKNIEKAAEKLSKASKVLKQNDQAHIDEKDVEELKDFAKEIVQERKELLESLE